MNEFDQLPVGSHATLIRLARAPSDDAFDSPRKDPRLLRLTLFLLLAFALTGFCFWRIRRDLT